MQVNEEARVELLSEVEGLSDEQFNQKPAEDSWSIKQILEHLFLMETEIVNNVKKELASGEKQTVEDKPIHLSVNRKYKVAAPETVQPSESVSTLLEIKKQLAESREKLIQLVKNTDEHLLKEKALPHPGFQILNLHQWISFIGWHEKRHIEQLKEVKVQLGITHF